MSAVINPPPRYQAPEPSLPPPKGYHSGNRERHLSLRRSDESAEFLALLCVVAFLVFVLGQ